VSLHHDSVDSYLRAGRQLVAALGWSLVAELEARRPGPTAIPDGDRRSGLVRGVRSWRPGDRALRAVLGLRTTAPGTLSALNLLIALTSRRFVLFALLIGWFSSGDDGSSRNWQKPSTELDTAARRGPANPPTRSHATPFRVTRRCHHVLESRRGVTDARGSVARLLMPATAGGIPSCQTDQCGLSAPGVGKGSRPHEARPARVVVASRWSMARDEQAGSSRPKTNNDISERKRAEGPIRALNAGPEPGHRTDRWLEPLIRSWKHLAIPYHMTCARPCAIWRGTASCCRSTLPRPWTKEPNAT
jgi:hypothetical protein